MSFSIIRASSRVLSVVLVCSAMLFAGCAGKKPAPVEPAAAAVATPPPPAPMPSKEEVMALWAKLGTPSENHALFKQYLGKWKTVAKSWMTPGEEPEVAKGTATFSSILGGRFLTQEYKGKMHGKSFSGNGLLAYDNGQEKFVSTWVDTASTGVSLATGSLDSEVGGIVMTSEFTCPVTKQPMSMRQIMTLVKNKKFTYEAYGTGPYGKEMKMLEVNYSR